MNTDLLYTPKGVMAILDIRRSVLNNFALRKFFPLERPAPVRGGTSYYSQMNIIKISIIRKLGALGIGLALAADIANDAQESFEAGEAVHVCVLDTEDKYSLVLDIAKIEESLDFYKGESAVLDEE